ncbi:MAG: aminomethyl-transferring glycine dehydrogenase subunit GcvPB [Planctomycetota bacterium]
MRNTQATQLIFELSKPGRRSSQLPACDVETPPLSEFLPPAALADEPPPLPEVAEPDVVRHYTNLSTMNMSVDTHFYPLGSCTMKYNPKRNEQLASLPAWLGAHPYQPESTLQGLLQLLYELQRDLGEISGLPAVSLQPAAGAHGELTALMLAAAYFKSRGEKRTKVLIPDSAHGTNPASARMAGFKTVAIPSTPQGHVDLDALRKELDHETGVFMITNPNTLGLFDAQVAEIAELVHARGGLIYLDGANMNAILGISRPGDFGADMLHFNPHKTFAGPHGGGGPGAGPICVTEALGPYLPAPVVGKKNDQYVLDYDRPKSLGRVRTFFGNVGVLIRAYCYIRTLGPDGLRQLSEHAVLNANYLLSRVRHFMPVPHGNRCMHEFVASAEPLKQRTGLKQPAMDVGKRLLDFGFHAPTVYFPMTVHDALMIEPTETESMETLNAFAEVLFHISGESAEMLQDAPHTTVISRPNEVAAARNPVLKWTPPD